MNKKVILIVMCMIMISLVLPVVTAYEPHKVMTNLSFSITTNFANNCTLTTINTPNDTNILNQYSAISNNDATFSINASNYTHLGTYCHNILCTDGVDNVTGQECREITYLGYTLSDSQATLYLGLILIMIGILMVTVWFIGKLPASNVPDEEGRILTITYLKYLRPPLWLISYFLFIGIIFIAENLAFAYLWDEMFGKVLHGIFTVLFSLSPVIVIMLFAWIFVKIVHDKQLMQYINRGMMGGMKF